MCLQYGIRVSNIWQRAFREIVQSYQCLIFLPIGSLASDFQTMRVYTFGNRSYKRESRVVYSYDFVNRIEMFAHDFADWLSQLCGCQAF